MAGTRKLSRTTSQRKALLNGLVTSLVLNGKIETTLAKAKEVKPLVDSLIDLAIKEKDNFEVKEKKISRAKLDKNGKKVKVQKTSKNGNKYEVIDREVVTEKVNIDKPSKLAARRKMFKTLNKVKDSEESKYLASSWSGFKEALNSAKNVLENDEATQEQVDAAYNVLVKAYLDLRLKPNKDLLNDLINKVQGLNAASYSAESWNVLQETLNGVQAVLDDPDATQAEVDAAYEALIRAYLDLRLIPNKDLLQGLINKAETLNATNYSAKTWSVMMEALDEAKAVLDDPKATQAEVDNAKEVLTKAMAGLEMIEASNPVKAGDTTASVATGDTTNMLYPLAGLAIAALAFYGTKKKKED